MNQCELCVPIHLQDLPKNDLNYSLYLPTGTSGSGKLGKFLDDGRMLADYVLEGRVPRLEVGWAH